MKVVATGDGYSLDRGRGEAKTDAEGHYEISKQPIRHSQVIVYQYGDSLNEIENIELPNAEKSRKWVQPMTFHHATTDAKGNFEFRLGDGDYDVRPPRQERADKF